MPSIGSVDVITIKGLQPQDPAMEVEEISRPETDGYAFRQLGKKGQTVSMVSTVNVANAAATITHKNACKALKGTLVTVTLDDGQQVTNVMVKNVIPIVAEGVKTAVGGISPGGGDYLVRMQWVLLGTNV